MSGVIYKFTCAECNLCYIGSTKRYWEKRLEEHLHRSALTGSKLTGMQVYAPMQHMRSDTCPSASMSRDEFTIIGREKNPYLLRVKESIFISTKKPKLNGNMTSVPMTLFTPYITTIFCCFFFLFLYLIFCVMLLMICLSYA